MSPAVSRNQQIAMNLAQAVQKGQATAKPGSPSAEIAASMKPSSLADFAGPIPAGLPKRVAPAAPVAPPRAPKPPIMKKKPGMKVKNVGKPVQKMRIV
jgi:hypothetical protein